MVRRLMELGADPTPLDGDREAPLSAAARCGHADVVGVVECSPGLLAGPAFHSILSEMPPRRRSGGVVYQLCTKS